MTSSNGNISALLAICVGNSTVPGKFPAQRPVTRSFDIFFHLRLNKQLNKQSRDWWFQAPSHQLWRHSNVYYSSCNWRMSQDLLLTQIGNWLTLVTSPSHVYLPFKIQSFYHFLPLYHDNGIFQSAHWHSFLFCAHHCNVIIYWYRQGYIHFFRPFANLYDGLIILIVFLDVLCGILCGVYCCISPYLPNESIDLIVCFWPDSTFFLIMNITSGNYVTNFEFISG